MDFVACSDCSSLEHGFCPLFCGSVSVNFHTVSKFPDLDAVKKNNVLWPDCLQHKRFLTLVLSIVVSCHFNNS